MDPNQSVADDSGPSLKDPELVSKLVEELKSQGIFDQIRSDCLAEVDTKVCFSTNFDISRIIFNYFVAELFNFDANEIVVKCVFLGFFLEVKNH